MAGNPPTTTSTYLRQRAQVLDTVAAEVARVAGVLTTGGSQLASIATEVREIAAYAQAAAVGADALEVHREADESRLVRDAVLDAVEALSGAGVASNANPSGGYIAMGHLATGAPVTGMGPTPLAAEADLLRTIARGPR